MITAGPTPKYARYSRMAHLAPFSLSAPPYSPFASEIDKKGSVETANRGLKDEMIPISLLAPLLSLTGFVVDMPAAKGGLRVFSPIAGLR